jgi:predicted RNA-binding protein with PUA-like domain
MAIWLLKTEPTVYSYADLERDGETMWDGVNNNTALQNIRKMEEGDKALIYHTGDERQVVGLATVSRGYYVNPEQDDPKLAVCDVKADCKLEKPITLAQIKSVPELATSDLVRLGRLSVVPISEEEWKLMQACGK